MSIFTKQDRDMILDALAARARTREDILEVGPLYTEVARKVHENSELVSEVPQAPEEFSEQETG